MNYIEENVDSGSPISHKFIRELHYFAVNELVEEGDRTPGAYRTWAVEIAQSKHLPPEPHLVQTYMEELIDFINKEDNQKFDLIKVAIAHHRFAWIHPFGNGNGRVVRLITYALLIKYGFKVKDGQLLNPTAVFCNDREKYYEMLSVADEGTDKSMLHWCEYVLTGICAEISKVNKLLDHGYLSKHVLKPAIALGRDRGLINKEEELVLKVGVDLQLFKSSDIERVLPKYSPRQRTHMITKLKNNGMIHPLKDGGREYFVSFNNNYLMRSLIQMLEAEEFIPSINE